MFSCAGCGLSRREETVAAGYGEVRKKVSEGHGATRIKYEYEDLARIARENGMSLAGVTPAPLPLRA